MYVPFCVLRIGVSTDTSCSDGGGGATAAVAVAPASTFTLLTAGAFVTMILPLVVFLALQRAFVRGILAGSVK